MTRTGGLTMRTAAFILCAAAVLAVGGCGTMQGMTADLERLVESAGQIVDGAQASSHQAGRTLDDVGRALAGRTERPNVNPYR